MFIPIDHTKTTMQLSRLLRKLDKSRTRSIFIHRDGSSGDNISLIAALAQRGGDNPVSFTGAMSIAYDLFDYTDMGE